MSSAHLKVEGLKELRHGLKAAGDDLGDLKDAGREAGELVAEAARGFVAHESGALEGTIRAAGQASGAVVRAGSAKYPYAGPNHFGWVAHHIEPNPFLYRGADARADEVTDLYLKRVQEITDKIASAAP